MDARTLESKINYLGMEKSARKILIDEKMASAEEVAVMTCVEVCEKKFLKLTKLFPVKMKILRLSKKRI